MWGWIGVLIGLVVVAVYVWAWALADRATGLLREDLR